ncbi:unnamed protein product [Lathyrus oleraceus]|uniref:DUF1442 family protein n=1 Tax=Pisum sativum TaxID=3888 RepID=A0A9D5A173_PEA|nr:uncharacterized protein LOC127107553 [Pisum sativum]KAI5391629.1 hypothetical protein KIW84_076443 [Pisum sativum]
MSNWSSENAKNAYLQTVKMAKSGKEPDVAEFISAIAAGKNAKLMVVAGASVTDSVILALTSAAQQTHGRVVCISCDQTESRVDKECVEFVVGDAKSLLLSAYKGADFVLVDCDMSNAREVFLAAYKGANKDGALVVGFNVRHRALRWRHLKATYLPIGEGLLVTKIDLNMKKDNDMVVERNKKSHWIVQVDNCTGEEHIFKVTSPCKKVDIEV